MSPPHSIDRVGIEYRFGSDEGEVGVGPSDGSSKVVTAGTSWCQEVNEENVVSPSRWHGGLYCKGSKEEGKAQRRKGDRGDRARGGVGF